MLFQLIFPSSNLYLYLSLLHTLSFSQTHFLPFIRELYLLSQSLALSFHTSVLIYVYIFTHVFVPQGCYCYYYHFFSFCFCFSFCAWFWGYSFIEYLQDACNYVSLFSTFSLHLFLHSVFSILVSLTFDMLLRTCLYIEM